MRASDGSNPLGPLSKSEWETALRAMRRAAADGADEAAMIRAAERALGRGQQPPPGGYKTGSFS
jgi:hypothetical protein